MEFVLFELNPTVYGAWRERVTSLEAMHGFGLTDAHLVGDGPPAIVRSASVTAGLLTELLEVDPVLGRRFTPEENRPGQGGVALLAESLWTERWQRDPGVLGRTVRLDGEPFRIVGVLPRVAILPEVEVWTPTDLSTPAGEDASVEFGGLTVLARRRPGVTLSEVVRDLEMVSERAGREEGRLVEPWRGGARDYREALVGDVRTDLWVLMGAVVLVLLIACVNVANLLLFRGTERRSELLVRSSLGARGADLARAVLVEGLLLSAGGGLVGLAVSAIAAEALVRFTPEEIPLAPTSAALDVRVLLFALGVTVLTALLFSGVPALKAARFSMEGVRTRGASRSLADRRRGSWLLGLEVAQATALLVAALLMVGSLRAMRVADTGFDPDGLLFMHLDLAPHAYGPTGDPELRRRFLDELSERLRTMPGLRSAGVGTATPFSGMTFLVGMTQEGGPRRGATDGGIAFRTEGDVIAFAQLWVDEGYLGTLGLPVVAGRALRPDDRDGDPVALINETAARSFWPGESALGRRVRVRADDTWITIVGVVRDFAHPGLPTAQQAEIYRPFEDPAQLLNVLVRFDGDPAAIAERVRRMVWSIDPELPIPAVRTAREALSASLATTRFYTTTLGLFAVLALALAAVGIYGVTAYSVSWRTREMGIRIALGARPSRVAATVLRDAMLIVSAGLALGLIAAAAGSRVMESLLYEMAPTDARVYALVAGLVALASAWAVWLPARRAARADPSEVLRAE
jgi:putative ABC transport system permease protein